MNAMSVHSRVLRAAVGVLLSIVGLGSAMGQSLNDDMSLRNGNRAARERFQAEIIQAKVDGRIKRWSPTLYEVPLKARRGPVDPLPPEMPVVDMRPVSSQ